MERESVMAVRFSSTVLITSTISLFLIMSTMWGRPSVTLFTAVTAMPAASMAVAVPRVARMLKPWAARSRATSTALALSAGLTLMNTLPDFGSLVPEAICDLMKASPKVRPTPITSPVDFISGPRMVSTPGNLLKGKTASFTE